MKQRTADMVQRTSPEQDGEEEESEPREQRAQVEDVRVGETCGVAIENDRGRTLSGNPKLTRSTRAYKVLLARLTRSYPPLPLLSPLALLAHSSRSGA